MYDARGWNWFRLRYVTGVMAAAGKWSMGLWGAGCEVAYGQGQF